MTNKESPMSATATPYGAYTKVDVETASQGKLVVMLFNGAIKRAEEAKRQLEKGKFDLVHNNLVRAQDILAELRSALNMNTGEVAKNLDRIYEYFQHLLINANVRKSNEPINECLELMSDMRDTWQQAFEQVARDGVNPTLRTNHHGAAVLNVKG
jgi:flagellar secretion chaperone FliS